MSLKNLTQLRISHSEFFYLLWPGVCDWFTLLRHFAVLRTPALCCSRSPPLQPGHYWNNAGMIGRCSPDAKLFFSYHHGLNPLLHSSPPLLFLLINSIQFYWIQFKFYWIEFTFYICKGIKISCLRCKCTGKKQTKKHDWNCNVITVFSTAVYHSQHCSDQYWSISWGHVITASSNSCSASEGVVSILQKDAAVSEQKCFPSDLINTASSSSSSSSSSGLLGSLFIDLI